jgi:hypothetical protein
VIALVDVYGGLALGVSEREMLTVSERDGDVLKFCDVECTCGDVLAEKDQVIDVVMYSD